MNYTVGNPYFHKYHKEVHMYTVYCTTNLLNNKYYFGVHKTENPDDNYLGSGIALKQAIAYYGRRWFSKEVLHVCDDKHEAYRIEEELVRDVWQLDECYNVAPGGFGGWEMYNLTERHKRPNPMHDPDIARRCTNAVKATRAAYREFYDDISRQNLRKAVDANRGSSRPDHSKKLQSHAANRSRKWTNEEKARRSGVYHVTDPNGHKYETNRLQQFCQEHGIPYVTLWTNTQSDRPITKGRAKGWRCVEIQPPDRRQSPGIFLKE